MTGADQRMTSVLLRIEADEVGQIDAYAEHLSELRGTKVSRSAAMRELLHAALGAVTAVRAYAGEGA